MISTTVSTTDSRSKRQALTANKTSNQMRSNKASNQMKSNKASKEMTANYLKLIAGASSFPTPCQGVAPG